ncbi:MULTISPECIES: class I SAM-dependent RNA methyltransferase [Mesorhizobium]|uniref:Class I SAM-dependent RNA methyltransferase n=1 Tax=Mesorhizobium denitrificans TaxID=2294114 RepID=A0A371XI05_9HYPH|nr:MULTISPECIES: class I SAM-dependent RNA methyltransferase [Mesorhizobium]RFC68856.1 class I SAM-dependent RNA methyltransferase [Mesorhizobium denitrificans]
MSTRFTISRLGAQGDGIAQTETGAVFIPFTLPGETVTAAREKDRATLIAVLEPSPQRVDPVCRYFGECGGCALQHLEEGAYRAWKREKVVDALRAKSIDTTVGDLIPCPPRSRRRAVFSARRTINGAVLGYNRALSHHIIDIEECPVVLPEIESALPMLRDLAAQFEEATQAFHLTVTRTASGLDVCASGVGKITDKRRGALSAFALSKRLARLSIDDEIIVEPSKPVIHFGDTSVTPPPGSFLQAVAEAENAMVELVLQHIQRAKKVADLFAGAGAFALRLARKSEVLAVEGDAAALAALDRGFRFASGLKRVTTERRDLHRRPLMFKELNAFDGVVFDPPRAGAEDQSKQIARSDVPFVAAVSCNPLTLARDLRILIDGGYRLTSVTPIDQFLWSPHVEAVALLEKPKRRR